MSKLEYHLLKLTGGSTVIKEIDSFSNYEAGGEFIIYEADRSNNKPMYICAFNDERRMYPLDSQIIEEIELGHRWKVEQLLSKDSTPLDDKLYYFYKLEKIA